MRLFNQNQSAEAVLDLVEAPHVSQSYIHLYIPSLTYSGVQRRLQAARSGDHLWQIYR